MSFQYANGGDYKYECDSQSEDQGLNTFNDVHELMLKNESYCSLLESSDTEPQGKVDRTKKGGSNKGKPKIKAKSN